MHRNEIRWNQQQYDDHRYGGHRDDDDRFGAQQEGMGQRGDRGYLARTDDDPGTYGGYGRDYAECGPDRRMRDGHEEGRFGGSGHDAYDHAEHPRYESGGDHDVGMKGRPRGMPGEETAAEPDTEARALQNPSS